MHEHVCMCVSHLLPAAHILSAIDPTTGKPLDDTRAKGEIAVFMAAGFETTSHSITWTLSMLVGVLAGLGIWKGRATTKFVVLLKTQSC